MLAPSPDNADTGWDDTSGYQYRAPTVMGSSNTHINGAGIPELGAVLLMPAQGERWTAQSTDFAATYDKVVLAGLVAFRAAATPLANPASGSMADAGPEQDLAEFDSERQKA